MAGFKKSVLVFSKELKAVGFADLLTGFRLFRAVVLKHGIQRRDLETLAAIGSLCIENGPRFAPVTYRGQIRELIGLSSGDVEKGVRRLKEMGLIEQGERCNYWPHRPAALSITKAGEVVLLSYFQLWEDERIKMNKRRLNRLKE